MAIGAYPHQLLRGVELVPQGGQHVHAGVGLALQQNQNVVAVHFDALGGLKRNRLGLVRALLQHGGKAKKFPGGGLVHDHFLMVLIHRGNAHAARHHHVAPFSRITPLINSLARRKGPEFDLSGQNRGLVRVETGK
jgi:hypothetical protein